MYLYDDYFEVPGISSKGTFLIAYNHKGQVWKIHIIPEPTHHYALVHYRDVSGFGVMNHIHEYIDDMVKRCLEYEAAAYVEVVCFNYPTQPTS